MLRRVAEYFVYSFLCVIFTFIGLIALTIGSFQNFVSSTRNSIRSLPSGGAGTPNLMVPRESVGAASRIRNTF